MSPNRAVHLEPIADADIRSVAEFLHRELNPRVSVADWSAAMTPQWPSVQPNHGYLLRAGGVVVGAYLALYSEREIAGARRRMCNLGAWCVVDDYRADGLRLLKALLRQRGYDFTDLSPSGNVVALNERLGFTRLDTTSVLVPNLPLPSRSRGVALITAPEAIERALTGSDLEIYRDHVDAAAAHSVALKCGDEACLVIFRRDRRKGIPLLASILYVGDPALFRAAAPKFFRHLLMRHAIPATLVELRVVRTRPARSVTVRARPKMYLSDGLNSGDIDYLYSELTSIVW